MWKELVELHLTLKSLSDGLGQHEIGLDASERIISMFHVSAFKNAPSLKAAPNKGLGFAAQVCPCFVHLLLSILIFNTVLSSNIKCNSLPSRKNTRTHDAAAARARERIESIPASVRARSRQPGNRFKKNVTAQHLQKKDMEKSSVGTHSGTHTSRSILKSTRATQKALILPSIIFQVLLVLIVNS